MVRLAVEAIVKGVAGGIAAVDLRGIVFAQPAYMRAAISKLLWWQQGVRAALAKSSSTRKPECARAAHFRKFEAGRKQVARRMLYLPTLPQDASGLQVLQVSCATNLVRQ